MHILFNAESNGVGKRSDVSRGLRALRNALPEGTGLLPRLHESSDFAPASQVKALPVILKNAFILRAALDGLAVTFDCPLLNLGGDCGSELVPVAWLNRRLCGELQVVWFDAHADLNLPATSSSGAFHGMVLRTLCGEGPSELAPMVSRPLLPSQITFAGIRNLDREEDRYIATQGIRNLSVQEIAECPGIVANVLDPEIATYVHVDYDALDGDAYPESTYPVARGLTIDALVGALIGIRMSKPIIGMSLTEYAPGSEGNGATVLPKLLASGFGLSLRF